MMPEMRRSTDLKRYHVTVEGMTVKVRAASVYFAAIVYNAVAGCAEVSPAPQLKDASVLRIREVGVRRVQRIQWRQVLDWANGEALTAFGEATTAFGNEQPDFCAFQEPPRQHWREPGLYLDGHRIDQPRPMQPV
jgi:hypothetical protein